MSGSIDGEGCANKIRKQEGGLFHHAEPNSRAGINDGWAGWRTEGSISGGAISEAIASLEKALAQQSEFAEEPIDEEAEQEHISLDARATPLREMLRHALQIDCYVMWRPE